MRIEHWLITLAAVAIMVHKVRPQPLGLRLNNPGNLKEWHRDGSDWLGEHPRELNDKFEEFVAPEYGIRAMGRVLKNYEALYGLRTVNSIIGRYAPASENHTRAYADYVADRLGLAPDQEFSVAARLPEMVEAIIYFEQGQQPFSQEFINYGLSIEA